MGLIRAAFDSAKTTLADQWLEYYYCDSLSNEVLIQKGTKVGYIRKQYRKQVPISLPTAAASQSMKDRHC